MLYEACSTEEERIALAWDALLDRPKLTAPRGVVGTAKGETRAWELLHAAQKLPCRH
ncbi:hypothetical protein [Streptomyces sp. NPDC002545]